jgi:hypothetical protein
MRASPPRQAHPRSRSGVTPQAVWSESAAERQNLKPSMWRRAARIRSTREPHQNGTVTRCGAKATNFVHEPMPRGRVAPSGVTQAQKEFQTKKHSEAVCRESDKFCHESVPRGPCGAERRVSGAQWNHTKTKQLSGVERKRQIKGEPDHAASPLQQEHHALSRAKFYSGVERSAAERQKQMKRPSGNRTAFSFKGE